MNPNRTVQRASQFYPTLEQYLLERAEEFRSIPTARQTDLRKVAEYVRAHVVKSMPAKLTFICTHNSRRSHLSQIWAQVAADYFGIDKVETYSGGTEATAFNPRAVAAMQRCGLATSTADVDSSNPRYEVRTHDGSEVNSKT